MGLLSSLMLAYSYQQQRNYNQEYKAVVGGLHALSDSFNSLTNEMVKSSFLTYQNQDTIAEGVRKVHSEFTALNNEPLLQYTPYRPVRQALSRVGDDIGRYSDEVDRYLMLNAGIKNSYIFLLDQTDKSARFFTEGSLPQKRIHHITDTLSSTKQMLDTSYLAEAKKEIETLRSGHYPSDQKAFVDVFILHAAYFASHFPEYIRSVKALQEGTTTSDIKTAQTVFLETARDDSALLDQTAVLLLGLFIGAMTIIIILLIRSEIENRNLKQLQTELEYSARYDQLTSLMNRFSFGMEARRLRHPTLLLLNIDRFKHINDLYGSETGNVILQKVAELLRLPELEEQSTSYFRLGGDDFGILLSSADEKQASAVARRLIQTIAQYPFNVNDIDINVSATVAINSIEPLLENADMALKHAKVTGSSNLVIFTPKLGLKEQIQHNISTIHMLKNALRNNRILPYYQPIVNLRSGKIEKYEALIRHRCENGEVLTPDKFLNVAMQTPLYREFTGIMIRKVMADLAGLPYRFSINLSMRDLLDDELMAMMHEQLRNNREAAKRLDIELLESEYLHDTERVERFIALMKGYGCQIAIDDFGSGYSNFSYLVSLPIDILKIDGSLIRKIKHDKQHFQTIKTIALYANSLGLKTVAEFVEDKGTAELLEVLGITYGQGYYFGKPAPEVTA
jgi:diguanylate cyclase (GGDEF)-like protein